MNPIGNIILPAYLGNHGASYVGNGNIPNSWTMIPNLYYLGNLPLTFSKTLGPMAYSFLNMVSTIITTTKGNQGVQASMVTPLVTVPIGKFFIGNLVPYFQPPTLPPPSRFSNSRGGIPTGGSGSPPHGSGGPPRRGNKSLGGGGGCP